MVSDTICTVSVRPNARSRELLIHHHSIIIEFPAFSAQKSVIRHTIGNESELRCLRVQEFRPSYKNVRQPWRTTSQKWMAPLRTALVSCQAVSTSVIRSCILCFGVTKKPQQTRQSQERNKRDADSIEAAIGHIELHAYATLKYDLRRCGPVGIFHSHFFSMYNTVSELVQFLTFATSRFTPRSCVLPSVPT